MNVFPRLLIAATLAFAPLLAHAADTKTITIFAAASMKNALDEANAAYTAKSGVKIVASYASSSVLAKQIEQAAPADAFLSADLAWMDYVSRKGAINGATRVAARIHQAVSVPCHLDGRQVFTAASWGIALSASG